MPGVCLYFQVHQPCRLKRYTVFQIERDHFYEDDFHNRQILNKVADKCYLPANEIILDLIKKYPGTFKVAFSITGITLDQFEQYRPDVLESFQRLAATGSVEFLCETYYHSLAFLFAREEFVRQVELHRQRIGALFGQDPVTFRYTELIYNNDLASMVEKMGYQAIITEGADKILRWQSPNYVYQPQGCRRLKCLLRNYRLSDDIAFRFSNQNWSGYPLTADKFAHWLHSTKGDVINIFIDYETFGEHQWSETGIFDFLSALPGEIIKHPDFTFYTPREAVKLLAPAGELDVPDFISWADTERDVSAWLGNAMQQDAARSLYNLEARALEAKDGGGLLAVWRRLQTSDHFYYMSTKWFADGSVHKYFNPYPSPYDAYINYMNILDDLSRSLAKNTENFQEGGEEK